MSPDPSMKKDPQTQGKMAEGSVGVITRKVQKQASRAKEKILQNLGKADKTTDEIFDDYVHNFSKQHNGALRLQKELNNYLRCVRAMQSCSKNLLDTVNEMYELDWNGRDLLVVQSQTLEMLWADFAQKLNEQVLLPLQNYMQQFPEVKGKIEKRGRKLLDYDSHRHNYEALLNNPKRRDEVKIIKTKEQLEEARQLYEVLNGELHDELPALYDSRIPFLVSNLQTICSAETVFHSECSKVFQELEVVVEKLNKSARGGKYNVKRHAPRSPRAPAQTPTSFSSSAGRSSTGGNVGATTENLPAGVLYQVRATYRYQKEDVDELSFDIGEIINVVEYDDIEDQEEGWLMGVKESTGEKGLFPANFTRPI